MTAAWQAPATHPWPVLAVAALVTALAVAGAFQLTPEADFVDTVPQSDETTAYRALLQELDGVRFVAIYMPLDPAAPCGDSLRDGCFEALVTEQGQLTAYLTTGLGTDQISHTLSVYEAMRAGHYTFWKVATAGNAPASTYSIPQDQVTYDQVKERVLEDAGDVLAEDGSSALLLVFLATKDPAEARELAAQSLDLVAAWNREDTGVATHDHQASGLLVASHLTDERNRADLATWGAIAAVAVALVLLVVVRRPTNVAIAVASMAVATTWTFGLLGLAGVRIHFLTVFLAPLVTGIGVDYAVHLLHRYEEERSGGRGRGEALQAALRHAGGPIALAATTTVLGLSVLGLVPAPLFAQVGLVGALGILLGFIAALTVAPALRAVLPTTHRRPRRDRIGPRVRRFGLATARRPAAAWAIVAVVTVAAIAVAATQTRVESGSAENEFPQDDPQILLQHRIEEEYGAFQRGYLVVQGDLARADALGALYDATVRAQELPRTLSASSVTDFLIADAATDDGALDILVTAATSPDDRSRLPASDQEAQEALAALRADPLWRTLVPFTISSDDRLAVVAVTVEPWDDQEQLVDLRDALREHADALQAALGPDYQVEAAGAPANRAAIVQQTPIDVALATAGAALVVGLVLLAAWRRQPGGPRIALATAGLVLLASLWLVASIPVLDSLYGLASQAGAPANNAALNDMFLLAFAVTVAVGVDDMVHLASRTWEARRAGDPAPLATALATTGRAITGTTATTTAAFASLAGLYFLQSKNLAILTGLGVLYAYLLTMTLAPGLLKDNEEARA
ncbi:MAG: MMPL family transporter [Thermoplasmatota archaeon]